MTHAKKIDSKKLDEVDEIGLTNRPLILKRSCQDDKHASFEHLFRLEFDKSTGIPDTWVDTKTLNYLNTLRDNIFASSSQYDIQQTNSNQKKK